MLYSLSRDVRRCPLNVALRVISQTLFETKKLFALAYVSVESWNMNKQIYALKIKLASLRDEKKISVLKLKIQQLEQRKKWIWQLKTQYNKQRNISQAWGSFPLLIVMFGVW